MKTKCLSLICLLVLVALAVGTVSAEIMDVNETLATVNNTDWVKTTGPYSQYKSDSDVCSFYGTSLFTGWTTVVYWNASAGNWIQSGFEGNGDTIVVYNIGTYGLTSSTMYPYVAFASNCAKPGGGNGYYIYDKHHYYLNTSEQPPLNADFTATPVSGTAPLYVSFSDNSTQNPTGWNWTSIGPGAVAFNPSSTSRNVTAYFNVEGNYTIVHGASNAYSSDIENKTNYIWVQNASQQTTLYITAINSLNGYPIHGATINLKDVENGSWVNTTTSTGTAQITGISTHTVNIYGSATGFSSNDKLGVPFTNIYDSILLYPANITNVTAGNVTLFVNVYDANDHTKPITGAGVTVIGPTSSQGQFTNSGGSAQFTVKNQTTYLLDVEAVGQGYQGATQSVSSGTGSGASASVTATVYLSKKTVTPTISQTTLPGGGTPAPTKTLLPGCTSSDDMSPDCQAAQNDYSMGWLSQNGLMLIQFFVLCFIIFMIKGIGK